MHLLWNVFVLVLAAEPARGPVEDSRILERARARDCVALRPGRVSLGDSIALVVSTHLAEAILEEAVAVWRGCANYGSDFPHLEVRQAGDISPPGAGWGTSQLEIRFESGLGPTGRCGEFRGRVITLYPSARTSTGRVKRCGSLALNLAHELGHALGLADAAEGPSCEGTIMAGVSSRNAHVRAASPEECRLVGARWLTLSEASPEREGASPPEAAGDADRTLSLPAPVVMGGRHGVSPLLRL
jgi:hypothetical protein